MQMQPSCRKLVPSTFLDAETVFFARIGGGTWVVPEWE